MLVVKAVNTTIGREGRGGDMERLVMVPASRIATLSRYKWILTHCIHFIRGKKTLKEFTRGDGTDLTGLLGSVLATTPTSKKIGPIASLNHNKTDARPYSKTLHR